MKEDVKLKIKGSHQEVSEIAGGEYETIENVHNASYIQKDGLHYIFYEEDQGDFPPTKNKIILDPKGVARITKKGTINSDMEFIMGQRGKTRYLTPYTSMDLEFLTDILDMSMENGSVNVEISYILELNGKSHSRSMVEIII